MKRALLIVGGTVGGLGAVLAITPPQLSATKSTNALSGTLTQGTTVAASTSPAPQSRPSTAATKKSTVIKPGASASASATNTPAPAATHSQTPATTGYSGTVTGDSFNARNYGVLSATVADCAR